MRIVMKACPSREQLEKLFSDQLSEEEERVLDAHVSDCAACQRILEARTVITETFPEALRAREQPESAEGQGSYEALISRLIAGSRSGSARTAVPAPQPPPLIDGFEILGKLGHGGMGIVYKARQLDLQRIVAIKMILAGIHADPQSLARFRAEAEAVAQLQHPNIVQIYAIGEAGGLPYFSLEYVPGGTLAQQLSGAPLEPHRAVQLVEVLARAVNFAHARGIVHRDLKPANILLTPDGAPKIADFGLAKRSQADGRPPSTEVGLAAGTLPYMAPEQLSPVAGGPSRRVGPASDIYALGAILYELLTGRPLFTGDSPLAVVVRTIHEDPTPPHVYRPDLPRDLETISLKCLAKNPADRYASARELADDLQRYQLGQPVLAQPPSILYRSGKFIRRHKTLVGAALAVAAALTAGIVVASILALREAHQRGLAEINAQQAENARQEALLEAYQARLAAALGALGDHNVGEAANQLNAVPEDRRGWEWHYTASRFDDSLFTVPGLGSHAVPFPGGAAVAAVTDQGIRIHDMHTAQLVAEFPARDLDGVEPVVTAAGTFLVQWRRGHALLTTKTGQVHQRFAVRENGFTHAVAVDRAGTHLAHAGNVLVGEKDELTIFDLATGKAVRRCIPGPQAELRSLTFSPDGRLLAGGGDERIVQIWDAGSGKSLKVLKGHKGFVLSLVFSPEGRRILSASADGTFRQWDTTSGQLLDARYGHEGPVNAAVYTPDGAWIVSGGADGTVRYWDCTDGAAPTVLQGHTGPVAHVAISANGREVTSVGLDSSARVFEGPGRGDPRILRGHTNFVYPVAFSPDGRWLASGGWDNVVRLWDAATGLAGPVLTGHSKYVASLVFSPDSRRVISAGADGTVRIWDAAAGKALFVHEQPALYVGSADTPHAIGVTPDGTRVAYSGGNRLYFWNLKSGQEMGSLALPGNEMRIVAFHPDGKQFACTGAGVDVYLVSAATGELRTTLHHGSRVHAANYSRDGSRLVSAGDDRDVRTWDTTTGECLGVMRGHTGAVFAAVFHPDGTRIASAGRDRTIRIWDAVSGVELARLQGHSDYVFSLQFSPDGATLASGSGDYTVRLWDTFPVARRLQKRALQSRRDQ
jgi:WD40 repeat protein